MLILVTKCLFVQEESWEESIRVWAQSKGLYPDGIGLERFPSFSGSYEGYECRIALIPATLATETILLCTHIEVLTKHHSWPSSCKSNLATKRLWLEAKKLDKHCVGRLYNLLGSIESNTKLLCQADTDLLFTSQKVLYIIKGANTEKESLGEALDILIQLAREVDQAILIIESEKYIQSNELFSMDNKKRDHKF